MIPTTTYPLAALTLMLWLLWSDSLRGRTPGPLVLIFRALLFIGATGVMLFNAYRYSWQYTSTAKGLVALASVVGLLGCVYFLRKALRPNYRPKPKVDDELRLKLD